MSSLQVASFRPQIDVKKSVHVSRFSSVPCITTAHVQTLSRTCLKLTISRPKYRRCPPVCVFGDGDKSDISNEEPLDNPTEGVGKKLSLEEILRQQMEKQEYYDAQGGGEGPPSDGGGGRGRGRRGRGGGGGADSGGSEEETPAERLDELLQVTLATMGLILLYAYILHGPEITRLAKDYFRFLVTGSKSVRLKRAMYVWGRFCRALTTKKPVVAEDSISLLQREILNTPTWWDSPSKYRHIVKAYMASKLAE